jgi:hypothetical protein
MSSEICSQGYYALLKLASRSKTAQLLFTGVFDENLHALEIDGVPTVCYIVCKASGIRTMNVVFTLIVIGSCAALLSCLVIVKYHIIVRLSTVYRHGFIWISSTTWVIGASLYVHRFDTLLKILFRHFESFCLCATRTESPGKEASQFSFTVLSQSCRTRVIESG